MPVSNGPVSFSAVLDRGPSSDALSETVVSIIAEVTRYPRDILKPEANLEEDLGIDSVKRAEILAVLRSRLDLPEPEEAGAGAPRAAGQEAGPPPPRTVGQVVAAVEAFLRDKPAPAGGANGAPAPPAPLAAGPVAPAANGPQRAVAVAVAVSGDVPLSRSVVDIIAEVTRYPRELLESGADLEEDLGFDAALRGTIFAALRSRLRLTLPEHGPLPVVRTIHDIVVAVEALLPAGAEARPAPPAPRHAQEERPRLDSAKPFTGKVALVTGSGHGLGKAIAAHLAGLGATVVVNSFHSRQRGEATAAQIAADGGQAVHLWGSVTNPAQLELIFREIGDRFDGLDFFVSSASNGVLAPMKDITPEHWDRAFRTNVVGLHQAGLLAAALMRRRGGGKIVALSSVGAQRYLEHLGCIGTVKAAVESLVRYLAVELGSDNIQVNAVSAGPVYGELMEKYPDLEKLRPRCEALTPRNRLNDEQEVAEAVTFLLGSSGMSGAVLLLDAAGSQRIRASIT